MHKTYDISVHHALLTEGSSRIVRPSRRRWSSSGDMLQASSLFRGHLRHPFSILLYMRTKPSPSRQRALNRSCFEPQKRNSTSSWKAFIWNCPFTMVESPSIPLRRSVRPHSFKYSSVLRIFCRKNEDNVSADSTKSGEFRLIICPERFFLWKS